MTTRERTWFTQLTSSVESSPEQVREELRVTGPYLVSLRTGRRWRYGSLSLPTLAELRAQAKPSEISNSPLELSEYVGDVQKLHLDKANENATFQVASQFNLLEMMSPEVSPERGVGMYEMDRTQGPACAIACGAGTIYRNYFVPIAAELGQSRDRQLDCLDEIGRYFRNPERGLWTMRNGYMLPTQQGIQQIASELKNLDANSIDQIRCRLKIGIQASTQVTLNESQHLVTQIYCSALPVAYTDLAEEAWEPLARIILEGAYEATFWGALMQYQETGNRNLYLTILGGGAFGNPLEWIIDAIDRSLRLFSQSGLCVKMVSYGRSRAEVRSLVDKYARRD